VSLVDVLPTLLQALGLPGVPGLEGASLWPLVARREALPERPIVAEGTLHGPERRALVRWPWKLVEVDGGASRLFDLERDPGERDDLAVSQPDRLRALGEELARLRARAVPKAPASEIDERMRRDLSALGYLE
jgi:arylsulfatase A-like enzyme